MKTATAVPEFLREETEAEATRKIFVEFRCERSKICYS